MVKMTVEYTVTEEQVERLEALLPYFRRHKSLENWTVNDVFQHIMTCGGVESTIDARLDYRERVKKALGKNETPTAGTAGESK